MYDQGKEVTGPEFRKYLIVEEYTITSKPSTSGNPTSNAILEQIHQVRAKLVGSFNITQTFVEKDDPWSGILDAE